MIKHDCAKSMNYYNFIVALNEFRSFLKNITSRGLDLYEQKHTWTKLLFYHSLLVVGEGHHKVVKINGG
jgi:hypothetical protein